MFADCTAARSGIQIFFFETILTKTQVYAITKPQTQARSVQSMALRIIKNVGNPKKEIHPLAEVPQKSRLPATRPIPCHGVVYGVH